MTLTPETVTPGGIDCVSEKETSEFALTEADAVATTTRLGESVGASFTAAILMLTVVSGEEDAAPSDAVTVKVLVPFSFSAGT